ncbi:MAG: lipoyl protein ligase domain-containing protein, partial [Candidatus Bipolaricaulota bacterium]
MRQIKLMDQGLTPYTKALELQNRLMTERIEGTIGDRLILLRHPPTITLGKSARKTDLLLSETRLKGKGFEIVEVGRGGGITY